MEKPFTERLAEIEICLRNKDLNRVGQRLMDLTSDYQFRGAEKQKSLALRERYNNGKELGKSTVDDQSLVEEYELLFSEILEFSPPHRDQHANEDVIVRISGIGKTFRSRLHNFNFKPISFNLSAGNIVGVVGENGNGKTTLLRMICGDLATDEGDIEYTISGKSSRDWQEINKKVAFIPQRLDRWFGTADDKISFEAAIKGYDEDNKEKVDFIIHRMGLTNFRELTWSKLSSGYKLRFEIAMSLVWDPAILILDEPLANLDLFAQQLLLEDLRNLADSLSNPISIILSSQQLHEVETIADQIIFLKNGRAVYNGFLKDFQEADSNNSFEINGNFAYQDLHDLIKNWGDVHVEQTSTAYIINCDKSNTKEELLKLMLDHHLDVNYFRDITGSTKKLFNDKY